MLDHVMNRLLHSHADVMTRLAGNRNFTRQIQHVKPAPNLRPLTHLVHRLAQIVSQGVQVVVFGINRPDCLVECRNQFPGHLGNLIEIGTCLFWKGRIILRHRAQQGYLGHPRSQIVMNVMSDAQPFPLQLLLIFELQHHTPHSMPDQIAIGPQCSSNDYDENRAPKPGHSPIGLRHKTFNEVSTPVGIPRISTPST